MHAKIHFVYLRHGISHNNQMRWLNPKNIRLIMTGTSKEYAALIDGNIGYKYTKKEAKLTGLPRHDALLKKNGPQKIILIAPTWRQYSVGSSIIGSVYTLNLEFMRSSYAIAWQSILNTPELSKIIKKYGYRVIFFPHPNTQPYLNFFNLPKHIEVRTYSNTRIQDLLGAASVMITDYSSVAFEMGLLQKSVLYYQFDHEQFFDGKSHTLTKGYFDYERDGFGKVCYTQQELLTALRDALQHNCIPEPQYLKRMQETFAFRDGSNCKRVFEAITGM